MDTFKDSLFEYATSFIIAEGKSIGTAPEVDLVMLDKDQTLTSLTLPGEFARRRKNGVSVGTRMFNKAISDASGVLQQSLDAHLAGAKSAEDFAKDTKATMRKAWREVFIAGIRSSGIASSVSPKANSKWSVQISAADAKWFASATKHEVTFLNRYVKAVVNREGVMPYHQRTQMYVNALKSFYESARVIGLPATVAIHWKGKHDERTCDGCKYLAAWSPYTKRLLPTVPRAGATPCLTNCRDSLLIRNVSPQKIQAIEDAHRYTRGGHIKNLREIKRTGEMPERIIRNLPK